MDYTIATGTTAIGSGDGPPATGTPGEFTDGDPATSTQPTVLPGYQMNAIIEEIIAVIKAAGLTPDRTNTAQLLAALNGTFVPLANGFRNILVFTPSGATLNGAALSGWVNGGNWTVPSGIDKISVICTGAGAAGSACNGTSPGGSGYSGAGGGSGATAIGLFSVTAKQQIAVNVAAAQTTSNGAGNTSSFGTLCTATGGQSVQFFPTATSSAGSVGGTASGGDLNLSGGCGSDGQSGSDDFVGNGGASYWGGGGRAGNGGGVAGEAPGSGGGGAYNSSNGSGGAGAAGVIVVLY